MDDRNVFVKFSGLLISLCTALWSVLISVALSKTALIVLYKHRIDIYCFKRNLIACTESVTQRKDIRVLRPLSICVWQTVVEIWIPQHPSGRDKIFSLLQSHQTSFRGHQAVGTVVLSPGVNRPAPKLTTYLYQVPRLRMSGAVHLFLHCAFMAWTGTIFTPSCGFTCSRRYNLPPPN